MNTILSTRIDTVKEYYGYHRLKTGTKVEVYGEWYSKTLGAHYRIRLNGRTGLIPKNYIDGSQGGLFTDETDAIK